MITVRLRMPAVLYLLSKIVDVGGLPILDLDQGVVELPARVIRIHQLPLGSPTLGRTLLEQANRVAIAIVEVADPRFLVGRGKSDRGSTRRQPPAY